MTLGHTVMYCITCLHRTDFAREFHHSGEYLFRCQKCGTWTLARPKGKSEAAAPIRKNPRAPVADIRKAAKLLKDFSGHAPTRARTVRLEKTSPVRLQVGTVTGIIYIARDGGRKVHYIHRFRAGSRPSLVASPDGKRLELLGGAFRFTERGIVDAKRRAR